MTRFLQFAVNGLISGAAFGLLAASFALIISVTQRFHIAYIVTFATGAYGAVWAAHGLHLPIGVAVAFGIAMGAMLGVIIESALYAPVSARAANRGADPLVPVLIASLGVTTVVQVSLSMIAGTGFRAFNLMPLHGITVGGVHFTSLDVLSTVTCLVVVAALSVWLGRSEAGRTIRGVRANPVMGAAVGIDVGSVYRWVFVLASALSAILGILTAAKSGATPGMGFDQVFTAFVVAFVAGTDSSPIRIALAGLVIAEIQSLSAIWIGTQWEPLVVFGILIVYLVVKPEEGRRMWRPRRAVTAAAQVP